MMATRHEPTPEQVQRYVASHFAKPTADAIMTNLGAVTDLVGDAKGWYQAAILVQWRDESDGTPDRLAQYIKIVNQDPRDFLHSFGSGPQPFWVNMFIHQKEM